MTHSVMLRRNKTVRALVVVAVLSGATVHSLAHASGVQVQDAEPIAPIHSYVTADDYPADALKNAEQGKVAFLLTVGVDGQPSDCVVTSSSGSSSLDSASCLIMIERARFRPARNAAGKPAVGTYKNSITWRLEDSDSDVSPPIKAATNLWMACAWGEAAKLTPSELSAAEIKDQAFLACAALEKRLASEMQKSGVEKFDPAKLIPQMKKSVEGKLPELLDQTRADLRGEVRE